MAEVAARSRTAALDNPNAQLAWDRRAERAARPSAYLVAPLRKHDCPPITDGAAAIVLAAGDVAREQVDRPAWIRGIDHRIEPHRASALRDLTESRVDPHRRREGRRRRRHRSTWPSCTPRSPTRS